MTATPALRMPAEWEPHEATWISWPRVSSYSFCYNIEQVRPAFLEMIRTIAEGEEVWINTSSQDEVDWISGRLDSTTLARVRFFEIKTNEPWCRDHGPTFVLSESKERFGVTWKFNSWGGQYPPYQDDASAGRRMLSAIGAPSIAADLTLEGGAIESNGCGIVMTTESCLLDPLRNPGLNRENACDMLQKSTGAEEVICLSGAIIKGDDTNGHIDMTTRFASPDTVVTTVPEDKDSPAQSVMRNNFEELEKLEHDFEISVLPLPAAFYNPSAGLWVPRVYTNFYICNSAVLVPAYGLPEDDAARQILADHFPTRKVVPIDCREIIKGHGALHCLTQQVPSTL